MAIKSIVNNVCNIGADHWDRKIFDNLIPLPDGTSYNAYLIKGTEKIALIDTVDPEKFYELEYNLKKSKIDRIDYIIANHAEQDHSGSIPLVLNIYPNAKVVTNEKCKGFLMDLLHIKDGNFIVVKDGEILGLGGKTLEFILTPWVHWPETMVTYLKEDKILFSCDFFGSHIATSNTFVEDELKTILDAKRYYAEIMMPFRTIVKKNIEKLEKFEINMIAPSHGPVYDKPELIINAYKGWVSDNVKNDVVIPYISMHGSTKKMVEYLTDALIEKGVNVKQYNLANTDIGQIAMSLVDASTVIIGTPTVLGGAHPAAAYAAFLTNALRPKIKYLSIIGSYGWGGKMIEQLVATVPNIKAEIIEPILVKGHPDENTYNALDNMANIIYQKHKDMNLV
ncbi:FprA family A-type flavoprotein [candidate division TA06 bacterium]|uniref:FprA family A-type flavoprotein n=1 Tax=candidate division TA06 bacterium TaxID=2250710 RepID=A0A660SNS2_UNCT6|nr:MAG: FprA family A-type flavoprotein [candidate division TA06 bacterium]